MEKQTKHKLLVIFISAVICVTECMGADTGIIRKASPGWRKMRGPEICSKEAVGKKVIPFLWCIGMCGATEERFVKEGHFSLWLVDYWQEKPTVTKTGLAWANIYRFMNKDSELNKQWVAVEFMDPPKNVSTRGSIGKWVEMSFWFIGKPRLNVPDNQDYKLLTFQRTGSDKVFIEKHKLKQMASYRGMIKIDDTYCCFYIVSMQKGRKSWKVEVVFPARIKTEGKELTSEDCAKELNEPINNTTAAIWLGHFKIEDGYAENDGEDEIENTKHSSHTHGTPADHSSRPVRVIENTKHSSHTHGTPGE